MNGKWFAVAIVMAGGLAACGAGRLVFDVDVYSFLKGSANDTIPYVAPPLAPNFSASNAAKRISLVPGLGSSLVDTVRVVVSADVVNQTGGPGTLKFQVYLASDSAGTYGAGKDSMFRPAPSVNLAAGANTQPIADTVPNLSPTGNALFANSEVWIRMVGTVSNSSATTAMQGKAVLTGLSLRVVVQDKVFH